MADPTYCGDLLWHAIEVAQVCGQDTCVDRQIYQILESVLVKGNFMSWAGLKFKFLTMWHGNVEMNGTKRMQCAMDVLTLCNREELGEIQDKLVTFCRVMHQVKMDLANANQLPKFEEWQDGWQNLPRPVECPFCDTRICGNVVWPKHVMSKECSESFLRI